MTNIFTNNFTSTLNPLSQFEIRDLILFQTPIFNNFHFSITNILEYIFISFMIIVVFNIMTNKEMSLLYKN